MLDGVDAILVEAIDLPEFARHLVMPTSKFRSFGFKVAHFEFDRMVKGRSAMWGRLSPDGKW